MKITTEHNVSDKELKKAIEIRFGRHFPAMNIMNALGGIQNTEWLVIRQNTPVGMVKEAMDKGIDVASLVPSLGDICNCGECFKTVGETPMYKKCMELIEKDGAKITFKHEDEQ